MPWLLIAITSVAAIMLSGCASVTQHGDARLYVEPNIVFISVDPLKFPLVPLGQRATYTYRVLDLPQEIYPDQFLIDIPHQEDSRWIHNQPWRTCVFRASLLTTDGNVFFSRTFDLSRDWNGGSEPGSDSDHRNIWLPFTDYNFNNATSSLPKYLSYIVRIEILKPSLRATDRMEIGAITLLPDAQKLMHDPKF